MNFVPMNDRVIVRERRSVTSPGGIYTGEQVDDGFVKELVEGEVIAVGPGLKTRSGKRDSMWGLEPGMVVRFSPVCSYKTSDGEYTVIRRDAIAGVVL